MADVIDKIIQQGGISGAFAIVFALACWKLYRDLLKAKDSKYAELKAIKEETEEKYRKAMVEVNNTAHEFDRLLDRLFDYLTRKR